MHRCLSGDVHTGEGVRCSTVGYIYTGLKINKKTNKEREWPSTSTKTRI